MKIINFKKEKMKLLTKDQQESYEIVKKNLKNVVFVKKNFKIILQSQGSLSLHNIEQYRGAAHSIYNLTLVWVEVG